MPKCRSCNAPIQWAKTATGKSMPLDAAPSPDGNVIVEAGVAHTITKKEVENAKIAADVGHGLKARYLSHWATCPSANQHRKPE